MSECRHGINSGYPCDRCDLEAENAALKNDVRVLQETDDRREEVMRTMVEMMRNTEETAEAETTALTARVEELEGHVYHCRAAAHTMLHITGKTTGEDSAL